MGNYENNEVYEISIKDLFNTFKRGLWLMVVTAIIFGALAFGYSELFIPKTYTASVKLYVEAKTRGEGSYQDLSSFNYASNLVNTYIEMLDTNNFYEKLSDNLDNKYTATQLSGMVSFSRNDDNNTEVFSSKAKALSPIEAKVIADSVAEVAPGVISSLNDNTELKIVDNATVPAKPSSPNVMRNTILAFAAGFILALIYVFAREALDNKIKYNNDLTEIGGIPILSAVPDFNGQKIIINTKSAENTEESEGK